MVSIQDVAKEANVSKSTVSRYINNNGYVGEKSKKNIQKAIEKLNYEPNRIARGLAGKKTKIIALILPDISNPFFSEIAKSVVNESSRYGYTVYIGNTNNENKKIKEYINDINNNYIDGVIFACSELTNNESYLIDNINTPKILLDRNRINNNEIVITSDNKLGAKVAVNHLLAVGCKKIAHLSGPKNLYTAKERCNGYIEAVSDKEWFIPDLIERGKFSIEGGQYAMEKILNKDLDIDGIFAGNDLMAIGAMKVLIENRIIPGTEVAICGFDGIEISKHVTPALTTIEQSVNQMGIKACRLLLDKIEDNSIKHKTNIIKTQICKRDSSLLKEEQEYE